MKTKLFHTFSVGLMLSSALHAADVPLDKDSENLIVYGVRIEQPATEVGSSVSIITADDIDALGVEYVLDALASAPGLTVNQNGPFGGAASVRLRGAGSEQTLVLIDGVVVNDPSSPGGGFNFARMDAANIERIEILKGPQSTLWGTDAIGGVVSIITKRPVEGSTGSVSVQAGSYGSLRGGFDYSGASDGYDFRVSATNTSTDGISKADKANGNTEDDGFDATTINASGGLDLPGDARLQLSLLRTDADADFDSFVFGAQGNVGDGDDTNETTELTGNISLRLPLFDGKFENLFLIGHTDIERDNFSDGQPSFSSEGDRQTFRYQGTVSINDQNRLAFGVEQEDSEANGEETSINGLFALYELHPVDTLTLTAGLRRDDHERFGAQTTARMAVAYNPSDQLTVRASWGEGFKAPSLFQTTFFCCGATAPNANLLPETSEAFDIGVTVRSADGNGELGVTYFDQDTSNLITFSFAIGGYENIAVAKSTGVELQGRFQFSEMLGLAVSYAYIDATDGSGTELLRVPEHSGDVSVRIDPDGPFSGALLLRYNGAEQDPNGVVDSWTRVDLSGRYQLNERLELFARIENLFDTEYQQILGYGTPGLSGSIGARMSF
jgi:vitamin B12 transporter